MLPFIMHVQCLYADRYIIVGCRYDAWSYGGVSPSTGTAVMMELVKALTKLSNEGLSTTDL